MIIDLADTTTSAISRKIDELHEQRGECTTGRVLTLLIDAPASEMEHALTIANIASREHPCRVIAVERTEDQPTADDGTNETHRQIPANLDAQVRFGADAGAGEIIILRPHNGLLAHTDTLVIPLLVPDAPIVAWWPTNPPANPATDLLGAMASSRITDAQRSTDMLQTIRHLQACFAPADIDLSWTRLTPWRALLASMLDQPPHLPILHVSISGPSHYLPLQFLASWLTTNLHVEVAIVEDPRATAITWVSLTRDDGVLMLSRPEGSDQAMISLPGQTPQPIALPIRTLEDCLSEELRRIDPDEVYANILHNTCLH